MALELENKWVWDFWFARDGDDYHLFYLQADKALGDPELRHWNVSVGHAVSKDLKRWDILPEALHPSAVVDAPDSYTTWTGCVIKQESTWYMFYTGTKRTEKGLIQRVCLATSQDLVRWQRCPANPIVELDERWYDGLNLDYWHDASWRDPWVMKNPQGQGYMMLVTCRANRGEPEGRGAIGRAYSTNLRDWTVVEPLLAPGWFGEMEVPQIEKIGDRYYLFCSVKHQYHSQTRREQMAGQPFTGVQYFVADAFEGPYRCIDDGRLKGIAEGEAADCLYSGRVVQGPDGGWYLMGFIDLDAEGQFVGTIADPMPIAVEADGRLTV